MAWKGLALTADGRDALNNAQISKALNFKSLVVGDGAAPENPQTQKQLVHQLFEITALKIDVTKEGCVLTADLPKMEYDYHFREIGVTATTEGGDILYVYDNCGDDAQMIGASADGVGTERRLSLTLIISDVEQITVSTPSILYVSYADYEKGLEELRQEFKDPVVTFSSDDGLTPKDWADVTLLESGKKLSVLFNKVSSMFKNVRWLHSQMGELKKSVSDGKKKVAGAITAQGVSTAADATFDVMASNIGKVGSGKYEDGKKAAMVGTAAAGNVLSGKTFTNASNIGASGSMPNRGAWTANTVNGNNVAIPAGYHNGSGYVSGKGAYNAGVTAADNRANPNSVNYKTGYNAGYAAGQNAAVLKTKTVSGYFELKNMSYKPTWFEIETGVAIKGIRNAWHNCVNGGDDGHMQAIEFSGSKVRVALSNHHNQVSGFTVTVVVLY